MARWGLHLPQESLGQKEDEAVVALGPWPATFMSVGAQP